jgi:hypothetical protein
MCCFKSLIAARLATSVFFAPVSAIAGNTSTTIPKPQARPPRFKMNGSAGASRRKYGHDSFWSARLTTSALPSKPRAILKGYRGLSKPETSPSLSEPMKTVIFDRFFFVVVTRTLPTQRCWLIWQREYEVAIDPAEKKPPCGTCRCGCSFVFPRSGGSNKTEPGRSRLSAKSQDLPAVHRRFALCWIRSVPKLPRGHAH